MLRPIGVWTRQSNRVCHAIGSAVSLFSLMCAYKSLPVSVGHGFAIWPTRFGRVGDVIGFGRKKI